MGHDVSFVSAGPGSLLQIDREELRAYFLGALQRRAHQGLREPPVWDSGGRRCQLAEDRTQDDGAHASGSHLNNQRAVLSAGLIKMDLLLRAVS